MAFTSAIGEAHKGQSYFLVAVLLLVEARDAGVGGEGAAGRLSLPSARFFRMSVMLCVSGPALVRCFDFSRSTSKF